GDSPMTSREKCWHRFHPLCLRIQWLMMLRSTISFFDSSVIIPKKHWTKQTKQIGQTEQTKQTGQTEQTEQTEQIRQIKQAEQIEQTEQFRQIERDEPTLVDRRIPVSWCPMCSVDANGEFIRRINEEHRWPDSMCHYFGTVLVDIETRPYMPLRHRLVLPLHVQFGDVLPLGPDELLLVEEDRKNVYYIGATYDSTSIMIPQRFWES